MDEGLSKQIARREAVLSKVRELLGRQLHPKRNPEDIDPDTFLFGSGLALDSLDTLELLFSMESDFQVSIPDPDAAIRRLRTVNSLVEMVLEQEEADHGC